MGKKRAREEALNAPTTAKNHGDQEDGEDHEDSDDDQVDKENPGREHHQR